MQTPRGHILLHGLQRTVNDDPSQFRVVVSGRRWGKTQLDMKEAVDEWGSADHVCWYVAPTFDMARRLMWKPILKMAHPQWIARINESRMELTTTWGCDFACKSAQEPDTLRGPTLNKVICDEFQDWPDGTTTWEEVLMPTLLTSNGRAIITGTPKSFNHLHALWVKGQPGGLKGWKSWQFKTADAPHINLEELEKHRLQMDTRSFKQEYEASFENMSGRAYYEFSRTDHVRESIEPRREVPMCISFDFNVHPATAVLWQKVGGECLVWREVYVLHAGGEATKASAAEAKAHLDRIGWTGEVRLYGDPAGKSAKTTGPSDHQVIKDTFRGAAWCIPRESPHIKDRVDAMNTRMRAGGVVNFYVDASCKEVIMDLEQVTMPMLTDATEKRKNPMRTHVSDALGYGVHFEWPVVRKTTGGSAYLEALMV